MMAKVNDEVAALFENIARLLTIKGDEGFRVHAYWEAARSIATLPEGIEDLHRDGRLEEIHGVGESIAAKIEEYQDTGQLRYYEELKLQFPIEATDLLDVPSIGPARAQLLHERLGITSVPELVAAARDHRLQALPGFGPRMEERILREAARAVQRSGRLLLAEALPEATELADILRAHPEVHEVELAGSVRRLKETVGDIDLVVGSERPREVIEWLTTLSFVKDVLERDQASASILSRKNLQIDVQVASPAEFGAVLQYFTGSKDHNAALRELAAERGLRLSEPGLYDRDDNRIGGSTEAEIYGALGLDWIPPELRENRGEIAAAQTHRLPRLVGVEDVRGDLHLHTDWSDGRGRPEHMIEAAIKLGYEYIAITDHTRSLRIAGGLSIEELRTQHQLVDRLNARYAPFRILRSAEVDILAAGDLDYPAEVLAEFDIVTASIHSHFSMAREEMTARIVRALQSGHVDILNHPSGRLLGKREPYAVDLAAVLRAAAEHGVAVEVNGQPDRLDLDDTWVRQAIELGIPIVCNSDAHATRELGNVRYAVAQARRGWATAANVLNTLSLADLLAHVNKRRTGAKAA
jgi:DNA polymerase (family 10)